jgi:hypothetical protein
MGEKGKEAREKEMLMNRSADAINHTHVLLQL